MTPAPHLPALTYPCPLCGEPHVVVARLGGTPGGGTPIVECPTLGPHDVKIQAGQPLFLITGKAPLITGPA